MKASELDLRLHALLSTPTVDALKEGFNGIPLYLVGGSVRDVLMGNEVDDLDFTTPMLPDDIERALAPYARGLWTAGKEYGTIAAMIEGQKVEITTYRSDRYRSDDRHPEVTFGTNLEYDLLRRDFTINSMAVDVWSRKIIDPFTGIKHLADRRIDTPGNAAVSMTDDPLRILRAYRFAYNFDFHIGSGLAAAIHLTMWRLDSISRERKTAELMKLRGPRALERLWTTANMNIREQFLTRALAPVDVPLTRLADDASMTLCMLLLLVGSDLSNYLIRETVSALRLPSQLADDAKQIRKYSQEYHRATELCDDDYCNAVRWLAIRRLDDDQYDALLEIHWALHQRRFAYDDTLYKRSIGRAKPEFNGNDLMAAGLYKEEIGDAVKLLEFLQILKSPYAPISKELALSIAQVWRFYNARSD